MSFMVPQVVHMSAWLVETTAGSETVPADLVSADPSPDEFADFIEGDVLLDDDDQPEALLETGWYSRFSAPGYMDRTDWCGPEETEDKALDLLAETHDVCRKCFEQCWEGDQGCPEEEQEEAA